LDSETGTDESLETSDTSMADVDNIIKKYEDEDVSKELSTKKGKG
jgi:hypothetical protein